MIIDVIVKTETASELRARSFCTEYAALMLANFKRHRNNKFTDIIEF